MPPGDGFFPGNSNWMEYWMPSKLPQVIMPGPDASLKELKIMYKRAKKIDYYEYNFYRYEYCYPTDKDDLWVLHDRICEKIFPEYLQKLNLEKNKVNNYDINNAGIPERLRYDSYIDYCNRWDKALSRDISIEEFKNKIDNEKFYKKLAKLPYPRRIILRLLKLGFNNVKSINAQCNWIDCKRKQLNHTIGKYNDFDFDNSDTDNLDSNSDTDSLDSNDLNDINESKIESTNDLTNDSNNQ